MGARGGVPVEVTPGPKLHVDEDGEDCCQQRVDNDLFLAHRPETNELSRSQGK